MAAGFWGTVFDLLGLTLIALNKIGCANACGASAQLTNTDNNTAFIVDLFLKV